MGDGKHGRHLTPADARQPRRSARHERQRHQLRRRTIRHRHAHQDRRRKSDPRRFRFLRLNAGCEWRQRDRPELDHHRDTDRREFRWHPELRRRHAQRRRHQFRRYDHRRSGRTHGRARHSRLRNSERHLHPGRCQLQPRHLFCDLVSRRLHLGTARSGSGLIQRSHIRPALQLPGDRDQPDR